MQARLVLHLALGASSFLRITHRSARKRQRGITAVVEELEATVLAVLVRKEVQGEEVAEALSTSVIKGTLQTMAV